MASTGSRDSLGSLLNDLGGVEAAILGRPKTLVGMKRDTQGRIPPAAKAFQAAAPAGVPPPAASQQSGSKPANEKARADHLSEASSKSTSGTAGSQTSQSRPKPARSSAVGKSPAVAHRADTRTGVTAEDFEAVFGSPTISSQAARAAPPAAPLIADDPFAEFSAGSQPMPAHHAGTIDMFGSAPGPPHSALQQPTPSVATAADDLLGGFAGPTPPPPARSTSVVSQAGVQSDGSSEFGEFHRSHSRQQRQQQAAPSAASVPRSRLLAENGAAPSRPAQSCPPRVVDRTGLGQAAEDDRTSQSPPSAPRSHRVFDYLDARESQDAEATRPASAGGAAPVDHGPVQRPHTAEHPAEVVAEMGQRAAKALTLGTKWFMQKSRQLAKDVQTKIEKGRHQPPHGRSRSYGSGGASSPKAYYYDWAGQLARLSPGTRAAALGAMGEDDRLHVQRILDEAEMGEAALDGSSRGLSGGGGGSSGRWSDEAGPPPPPPAYEDVVMEQAACGAARKMPAAPQPAADLLRMDSDQPDPRPTGASPSAELSAAPMATVEDDLLGMGTSGAASSGGAPGSQRSTAHIDDMFTVGASRPALPALQQRATPPPPPRPPASAAATASRGGQGLDSMIDMGSALPQVDTTGFSQLYDDSGDSGGAADEPEIRKVLRQRRVQEKHERMQRQLGEARAREEAAEAERSGKVELRVALRPRIDAWSAGKKDNIRALLSTLHVVLWEGSGWVQPSMADIVDPGKVKRWYMKANLVVHPDKVKQKGGTLEQVTIADMVFDVLKGAWGKFEASN